jgi:hypothetical protein
MLVLYVVLGVLGVACVVGFFVAERNSDRRYEEFVRQHGMTPEEVTGRRLSWPHYGRRI